MTVKQIKQLAVASYTRSELDSAKVRRVVKLLNREGLKTYVKYLKSLEKKKNVDVFLSSLSLKSVLNKSIRQLFPNKNVRFLEDKALIAGVKVVDDDNIFDFSLKNTFENLVSYINR